MNESPEQTVPEHPTPSPSPLALPWTRFTLLLIALFFLGIWVYPLLFRDRGQRRPLEPLLGKPAQGFELERLDAPGKLTLHEFQGRIVLLNFWASWCDACREEASKLSRLARESTGSYVVVGIGIQDTVENLKEFAQKYGFQFPLARDPEGELAIAYGVTGIPETFLIDSKGIIRQRWRGPIAYETVKQRIEKLHEDQGS